MGLTAYINDKIVKDEGKKWETRKDEIMRHSASKIAEIMLFIGYPLNQWGTVGAG